MNNNLEEKNLDMLYLVLFNNVGTQKNIEFLIRQGYSVSDKTIDHLLLKNKIPNFRF